MRTLFKRAAAAAAFALPALVLVGCDGNNASTPAVTPVAPAAKNVIFFLGDGMGTNMITAARIYQYGEAGELTMDTLPETAWLRTYSNDAQTTDSAPSMSAYTTGVKMNNDVISMSADTKAFNTAGATPVPYVSGADSTCPATGNGTPARTILELAKAAGKSVGAVTTTRITHATPAATYAHICNRDGENTIAAQTVPGGAGFNAALGTGVDVLLGGGRQHFLPSTVSGGRRTDGRDLTAELRSAAGGAYAYVSDKRGLDRIDPVTTTRLIGLFTNSHMNYERDRNPANEPSLSDMSLKALSILQRNPKGFYLMVEGGRIDQAEHATNMARALADTIAFDDTIRNVLAQVETFDPGLKNTLIVVTADHDHTLVMNGYARRTGPTTPGNPGILGLVKNVVTGNLENDADGRPYTNLGFGNGENRVGANRNTVTALDETTTSGLEYHQEAAVRMSAGGETHGGTDVPLMAAGAGSEAFHGFMTNTEVFPIVRTALGL
ncbi:MAG: alkaline phosphatase [Nevskia sp.]